MVTDCWCLLFADLRLNQVEEHGTAKLRELQHRQVFTLVFRCVGSIVTPKKHTHINIFITLMKACHVHFLLSHNLIDIEFLLGLTQSSSSHNKCSTWSWEKNPSGAMPHVTCSRNSNSSTLKIKNIKWNYFESISRFYFSYAKCGTYKRWMVLFFTILFDFLVFFCLFVWLMVYTH